MPGRAREHVLHGFLLSQVLLPLPERMVKGMDLQVLNPKLVCCVNYLTFGATIAKILRNNANIGRKYDVQACRTYFLLSLYNGFRYIIQVGGF